MSTERARAVPARRRPGSRPPRGQVLIFLVLVLTILTFAVLWNMDLGHVLHVRMRSQNGVDAAALAAAGWQARSLNAVGELNLLMASAKLLTDVPPGYDGASSPAALRDAIAECEARILLLGPLIALESAQQAARENGIHNYGGFSRMVIDHAELVRAEYPDWMPDDMAGFQGWIEVYADALAAIADEGLAVGPRNSRFFRGSLLFTDPRGERYLADRGFYYAVASRDWCYLEELLYAGYSDPTFWGTAELDESLEPGSEFLPLGVRFASFDDLIDGLSAADRDRLLDLFGDELRDRSTAADPTFPQINPTFLCAVYATAGGRPTWDEWAPRTPNPVGSGGLVAPARAEYDYAGCDAVFEIRASPSIGMTPETGREATGWIPPPFRGDVVDAGASLELFSEEAQVTASAAAKPIGAVQLPGGGAVPPQSFAIVLPGFTETALIPLAYASAGDSLDPEWREHLLEHVPAYLSGGTGALNPGCWYCRQLRTWDDPAFRAGGRAWHEATDPATGERIHHCPPPTGGPGEGWGGFPIVH